MTNIKQAIDEAMQSSSSSPAPTLSPERAEQLSRCAGFDQNDIGNSKRLKELFGRDFLYVRDIGFHAYDKTHWSCTGGDEAILRYAQQTAELIKEEANLLTYEPWEKLALEQAKQIKNQSDDEEITLDDKRYLRRGEAVKKVRKGRQAARKRFAISSGNSNRISGMITQVRPHVTVAPAAMDADQLLFNVQSETLSLHPESDGNGGRLLNVYSLPHEREMRLAKCAPVNFNPDAKCPKWQEFLDYFQPDLAIQKFLQVYTGYCLTGLIDEQKLLFFYGDGSNGKSTFIEVICTLLGEYAGQLNPESVTGSGQRRGDQATPDLVTLAGKRLVRVSELPRGEAIKEELVKSLTGGEPIMVRQLQQGFFLMSLNIKAIMSGNDKPFIKGSDFGIWRRLLLVPWSVRVSEEFRRPMADVLTELRLERPGILNWMLEGLKIYFEAGLQIPQAVEGLTADYRSELDPVQQFVDACIQFVEPYGSDPDEPSITGRSMYDTYRRWSEISGLKPFTETSFGKELPKKEGMRKVIKRIRKYANVRFDLPPEMCLPE